MQTSNPNVFAIGDIAAFPLKMEKGVIQRQEHVINGTLTSFIPCIDVKVVCSTARQTARHAVDAMLALEAGQTPEEYDYLPSFYSRLFGFSWKFYGVTSEADAVHFGEFK